MTASTRTKEIDGSDDVASYMRDQRIVERCEALGLSLQRAMQLAIASDSNDPDALLRILGLDFSTLQPMLYRRPKRWLWMAARTSSVSYRGALTEEMLLSVLLGGEIPHGFEAHIGHLLDEAPIEMVVLAVEEAAQRSKRPIREIWIIVHRLADRYSYFRSQVWLWD